MDYSIDVNGNNIVVDLVADQFVVDAETVEYAATLSRTGSQGSQGVPGLSVVSAAFNNSNELIFTMSDASQLNAGNLMTALLNDSTISIIAGTGLSNGGTFTTNSALPAMVTINLDSTTQTTLTNANTAYGWGDHASGGYLTTISGQSIEALSDVNAMTPTDGQVLTWDNANSRWDTADVPAATFSVADLTAAATVDIDLSTTAKYFTITPTSGLTTFTFSNPSSVDRFELELTGALIGGSYLFSEIEYASKSVSVGTQEAAPQGFDFSEDGTKMYVAGVAEIVYQYTLSTAWDVSTATYDSVSYSITEESTLKGFALGDSGTKFYAVGYGSDTVFQYTMSTPYDLSTASYASKSFSISSQTGLPLEVRFKPDGTKMYVSRSNAIYQYSLSTAWDVSTASYDSLQANVSGNSFAFNSSGTKLWGMNASDLITEYDLSTAWDVSTETEAGVTFSASTQDTGVLSIQFGDGGTKLYALGNATDSVYQYTTGSDPVLNAYAFPVSVDWSGGSSPETPANGERKLLQFTTTDGGTAWLGA